MTRELRIAFCGEGTTDSRVIPLVNQAQLLYSVIVVHIDADGPDAQQVTARKVTPAMDALTAAQLPTETIV